MTNARLMVNLLCRRQMKNGTHGPQINIIFLIHTGIPLTYLSKEAMQALIADPGASIPKSLMVKIHDHTVITCYVPPEDWHFGNVNVLGMDYIVSRQLSIYIYPEILTVDLIPTGV